MTTPFGGTSGGANADRILVTGGTGFLGSHLVERLVRRGAMVTVVDNLANSDAHRLSGFGDQLELQVVSVLSDEFADLLAAQQFETIFHFAGNASVPFSVADPMRDFESTLTATMRLLNIVKTRASNSVVVFASSAAVYGTPQRLPVRETDPTVPQSPYGVAKLAAERYLTVFCELYGLRGAAARIFSPYGPFLRKQIVYDFLKKLVRRPEVLEIIGDGTQTRDFIYVSDVIDALLVIRDRGALKGEVYNVGSGCERTTAEIAQVVARALGVTPGIRFSCSTRPGEPDHWLADITRLKELGWKAHVGFEDGIRETAAWFLEEGHADS